MRVGTASVSGQPAVLQTGCSAAGEGDEGAMQGRDSVSSVVCVRGAVARRGMAGVRSWLPGALCRLSVSSVGGLGKGSVLQVKEGSDAPRAETLLHMVSRGNRCLRRDRRQWQ